MSGFGIRFSVFGIRYSDLGFRVFGGDRRRVMRLAPNFRIQVSDVGIRDTGSEVRVSGFRILVSGIGF